MAEPKLPPKLFGGINTAEFIAEFGNEWHQHSNKTDVWWLGAKRLPVIAEWDGTTGRLVLLDIDPGYYFSTGVGLNCIPIRTEGRTMEEIREDILANFDHFHFA